MVTFRQSESPTNFAKFRLDEDRKIITSHSNKSFNQEPLLQTTANMMVIFRIFQTLFLLLETAFYSFPQKEPSLQSTMFKIGNTIIGRDVIDIENFDFLQAMIMIMISVYLIILLVITIIYWGNLVQLEQKLPLWIKKNRKNLLYLHFHCLFLPIYNISTQMIFQSSTMSSAMFSGILIFSSLLHILNGPIPFICLFSWPQILKSDPLATMNSYFFKFLWIERALLGLINLLLINQKVIEISSYILNLINFTIALCRGFLLLFTIPFNSTKILNSFLFETGLMLLIPLVTLILGGYDANIIRSSILSIILIVLMIIPGYFKLVQVWLQSNLKKSIALVLNSVLLNEPKKISNVYWFIQGLFYLKSILNALILPHQKHLESSLKQIGAIKHLYKLISDTTVEFGSFISAKNRNQIITLKLLTTLRNKIPKNSLIKIVLAEIMVYDFELVYEPYQLVNEVLNTTLDYSLKFRAREIREMIQDIIIKRHSQRFSDLDLAQFFEGIQVWQQLKCKIVSQINQNEDFFESLQSGSPDLFSIMRNGCKVQALNREIDSFWKNISSNLLDSDISLNLFYGLYKIYGRFQYEEGRHLLEKYKLLAEKRTKIRDVKAIDHKTLFSDDNALFILDTAKGTLGNIVHCSKNVKKIFREEPRNLIGKNVRVLMPSSFHDIHNSLINKKLETSESALGTRCIFVLAMDKQGFLFPINILISIFPWVNEGFFYIGLVRKVESDSDYILFNEQGYIDSYSRPLQMKLGLPHPSQKQKVNIIELCRLQESFDKLLHLNESSSKNQEPSKASDQISSGVEVEQTGIPSLLSLENDIIKFNSYACKFETCSISRAKKQESTVIPGLNDKEKLHAFAKKYVKKSQYFSTENLVQFNCSIYTKKYINKVVKVLLLDSTSSSSPKEDIGAAAFSRFGGKISEVHPNFEETLYSSGNNMLSCQSYEGNKLVATENEGYDSLISLKKMGRFGHDIFFQNIATSTIKAHTDMNHYDMSAELHRLKFFRFPQAKMFFLLSIITLIALLVSNIIIWGTRTKNVSNVDESFPILQGSLDRRILLVTINYYVTNIKYHLTDVEWCQTELYDTGRELLTIMNQFESLNKQVLDTAILFTSSFYKFLFTKSIRLYTEDFTKIILINPLQAVKSIHLHVSELVSGMGNIDQAFHQNLEFLSINMFNDFLIRFQQEPSMITQDIHVLMEETEITLNFVFIITLSFFVIIIVLLSAIYMKSFMDISDFLKYFVSFHEKHILEILININWLRSLFNMTVHDKETAQTSNTKNRLVNTNSSDSKTRAPKVFGLLFTLCKRALSIFVLVVILITVVIVLKKGTNPSFETIIPSLSGIIKPKEIIMQSILSLAAITLYADNRNSTIYGKNASVVINENIESLNKFISVSVPVVNIEDYSFYHLDYCQFITSTNLPDCKRLLKGASSSGITGTVLVLGDLLKSYKEALETNNSTKINWFHEENLIKDAFRLTLYANEAISSIQSLRFYELTEKWELVEQTIKIFIILSLVMFFGMTILGGVYVYLPLKKERERVCKLMLLLPIKLICSNLMFRSFLKKESLGFRQNHT